MLKKKDISVEEAFLQSCDENDIEYKHSKGKKKKENVVFVDDNKKEFVLTPKLEVKDKKRFKKMKSDDSENSLFACALNNMDILANERAVR